MRKWFANPVTSALLLALLIADAYSLPIQSKTGRMLTSSQPMSLHLRIVFQQPQVEVLIAHFGNEVVVFSREEASQGSDPRLERVLWNATGQYREDHFKTGWWALTQDHGRYTIALGASLADGPVSDELLATARSAFADWLRTNHNLPDAIVQRLRTADCSSQTPILSGYLHNTISLLVFIAFLLSLDWIPRYTRSMIRSRRKARGQCTRCGYTLRGLATDTCPECGTSTADPATPRH